MKDMYSIYLKLWHTDYRLKLCTVNMSHITRQSIVCNVFIIFMTSQFDGSASPLVKRSLSMKIVHKDDQNDAVMGMSTWCSHGGLNCLMHKLLHTNEII
jgi:hypothetical protein